MPGPSAPPHAAPPPSWHAPAAPAAHSCAPAPSSAEPPRPPRLPRRQPRSSQLRRRERSLLAAPCLMTSQPRPSLVFHPPRALQMDGRRRRRGQSVTHARLLRERIVCQADKSAVSDGVEDQGAQEAFMYAKRESCFVSFCQPSLPCERLSFSARERERGHSGFACGGSAHHSAHSAAQTSTAAAGAWTCAPSCGDRQLHRPTTLVVSHAHKMHHNMDERDRLNRVH